MLYFLDVSYRLSKLFVVYFRHIIHYLLSIHVVCYLQTRKICQGLLSYIYTSLSGYLYLYSLPNFLGLRQMKQK